MGLRDDILKKPREASGAAAGNRFDFQKDWALCRLFDLHIGGRNYLLVLEHHEDVVILFFDPSGETAECYQIKTRELHLRRWSLNELLERKKLKKGTALSILGKMYNNCRVLGTAVASVNFVTNAPYTIELKSGVPCDGRRAFCLDELDQASIDKIHKQMAVEHSLPAAPVFVPLAHLQLTDLSLQGHDAHATGKCAEFLEQVTPGKAYPVKTVYRTLFDEIRRRSDYEWDPTSWEEIVKHKSICKNQFQEMLDSIPDTRRFDAVWASIQSQLTSENETLTNIMAIRRECRANELHRMDFSNVVAAELRRAAAGEAPAISSDASWPTLRAKLEAGVAAIRRRKVPGDTVFSDQYLKATILLVIYEY